MQTNTSYPMLFQDRNYSVGTLPFLSKVKIALDLLQNPLLIIPDKLGLQKHLTYQTKSGIKFKARSKTTDFTAGVVVLSGKEYPSELLGITGIQRPTVVDCGGHIGTFTLFVKSINKSANVFVLEPMPDSLALLKENLTLNGISDVTIAEKALYSRRDTFPIYMKRGGYDGASVDRTKDGEQESYQIEAITLEDLVKTYSISIIDLLKMDIEGSEYAVLEASYPTIKNIVKRIVMEYHNTPDHPHGRREIVEKLTADNHFALVYETQQLLGFYNTTLV